MMLADRFHLRALALLVFFAFLLASCVSFAAKGMSFGKTDGYADATVNRYYFEERIWISKFLGSSAGPTFANLSQRNHDYLVADACHNAMMRYGGVGVEDVSVIHEAGAGCILLNIITLGIYAPSEMVVSGYVLVPVAKSSVPAHQPSPYARQQAVQPETRNGI